MPWWSTSARTVALGSAALASQMLQRVLPKPGDHFTVGGRAGKQAALPNDAKLAAPKGLCGEAVELPGFKAEHVARQIEGADLAAAGT